MPDTGKLPNLYSIGGMRCGSTTIYNYLQQHPDIFIPDVKEPYFFLKQLLQQKKQSNSLTGWYADVSERILAKPYQSLDHFLSLYESAKDEKYFADCSHYLHHPETAELIHQASPNAKFIMCLRDPTLRLYSEYTFNRKQGTITSSFKDFIDGELDGDRQSYIVPEGSRLRKGFYSEGLVTFRRLFGNENVKVVIFDDLKQQPHRVIKEIFSWLNVDSEFQLTDQHSQLSGIPRSKAISSAMQSNSIVTKLSRLLLPKVLRLKIRHWINLRLLKRVQIDSENEAFLRSLYLEEVEKLESLCDRDFSSWK